jgi:hypothetical protein
VFLLLFTQLPTRCAPKILFRFSFLKKKNFLWIPDLNSSVIVARPRYLTLLESVSLHVRLEEHRMASLRSPPERESTRVLFQCKCATLLIKKGGTR